MKKLLCMAIITTLILAGCGSTVTPEEEPAQIELQPAFANRDTMYQAATLQSLMLGDYYGTISIDELVTHGDFGLGTFGGLDGEMIVLDGVAYQAKSDGSLNVCDGSMTTPFCSVTFFDNDSEVNVESAASMEELKTILTSTVGEGNPNFMYAAKLHGTFDSMTVRTEYAQEEPYKELATVMLTDQVISEPVENIEGTLVAVYFPDYMDGINTPGWHFHFVADDKSMGGHVLDFSLQNMVCELDSTDAFEMHLPNDPVFKDLSLTTNMADDIADVEK